MVPAVMVANVQNDALPLVSWYDVTVFVLYVASLLSVFVVTRVGNVRDTTFRVDSTGVRQRTFFGAEVSIVWPDIAELHDYGKSKGFAFRAKDGRRIAIAGGNASLSRDEIAGYILRHLPETAKIFPYHESLAHMLDRRATMGATAPRATMTLRGDYDVWPFWRAAHVLSNLALFCFLVYSTPFFWDKVSATFPSREASAYLVIVCVCALGLSDAARGIARWIVTPLFGGQRTRLLVGRRRIAAIAPGGAHVAGTDPARFTAWPMALVGRDGTRFRLGLGGGVRPTAAEMERIAEHLAPDSPARNDILRHVRETAAPNAQTAVAWLVATVGMYLMLVGNLLPAATYVGLLLVLGALGFGGYRLIRLYGVGRD